MEYTEQPQNKPLTNLVECGKMCYNCKKVKPMKNFGSLKSGHAASDAYFKNQPIWYDSDMLRSCMLGFCIGVIVTSIVIAMCI